MRTSERCNTSKDTAKETVVRAAPTLLPSIWEPVAEIPFSKSSRRRKTPRDATSAERWDHGAQAILRSWWPIHRRLKKCWDGPPSARSPISFPARGPGCRKPRAAELENAVVILTQIEVPVAAAGQPLLADGRSAQQRFRKDAPGVSRSRSILSIWYQYLAGCGLISRLIARRRPQEYLPGEHDGFPLRHFVSGDLIFLLKLRLS